jgi:hypothetical protein
MKVVTNQKLIERNKKIGQYTSIASLVILLGGLIFSFQTTTYAIAIAFGALLLGFILSQVGIYFGTRWGKSPRPDEVLTASLKGLEEKYTLYHYLSSVSHLLIGPAGIWVLIPYPVKGIITYDETKERWKHKGGSLYLKIFAQEGMGRPDMDIENEISEATNYIQKVAEGQPVLPIQAALVFTNEKITVDAANAPTPTLAVGKLKDFIRKKAKEEPASMEIIKNLQSILPKENITV